MNEYNRALLGLGECDTPWLGCPDGPATSPTSTTGKKSITDTISDWLGIAKEGAGIFQTVKNADGTVTYVMPQNTPAPATNNTMKYVLIGGGALLAAGAIVMLTRGKKKLGEVAVESARKKKKRKK